VKVLFLTDMHGLKCKDDLVEQIVDEERADVVVLGGDNIDCAEISPFGTKSSYISLDDELQWAVAKIDWLAKNHRHVVVLQGNHEQWWGKKLRREMATVLQGGAIDDICKLYARGYVIEEKKRGAERVREIVKKCDWKNVKYYPGPSAHMCRIGDVIYAHGHQSRSIIPGRSHEFFTKRFILPRFPGVRLVLLGHLHRSNTVHDGEYTTMEVGCLCNPSAYETQRAYGPMRLGYAVVEYDGPRHNLSKSKNVQLGWATALEPADETDILEEGGE
jgi:DNA repair exonuclease SbcCD nuclease subunit